MKRMLLVAIFFLACIGVVFGAPLDFDINEVGALGDPSEITDQFSYVYGYIILKSVLQAYPDLNLEYWAKGLYDSAMETELFSASQMQQILAEYQMKMVESNAAEQKRIAEKNRETAVLFLAANKNNPKVFCTESGLQYEITREGTGERPFADSNVRVNYKCTLLTGTVIDSSYDRKVPSDLSLRKVIGGLAEGIQLMKVGAQYRFWIPPELGYGESSTNVEPNSLLVFEVELLGINR